MSECFKRCPCCQQIWTTQDEFISDKQLELNGYQADFIKLEDGMFFFTHDVDDCGSTMAKEVTKCLNLYEGPYYQERRTGMDDCPGYCKDWEQQGR